MEKDEKMRLEAETVDFFDKCAQRMIQWSGFIKKPNLDRSDQR